MSILEGAVDGVVALVILVSLVLVNDVLISVVARVLGLMVISMVDCVMTGAVRLMVSRIVVNLVARDIDLMVLHVVVSTVTRALRLMVPHMML